MKNIVLYIRQLKPLLVEAVYWDNTHDEKYKLVDKYFDSRNEAYLYLLKNYRTCDEQYNLILHTIRELDEKMKWILLDEYKK